MCPGSSSPTAIEEGPSSAVAVDPHPCRGAGPALHRTWTFNGTRLRGYIDDVQMDFAFTQFLDDHTVRISHINLGFTIEGDTLTFIVPPIPRTCAGPDCLSRRAWAVAAFGMGPWTRTAER